MGANESLRFRDHLRPHGIEARGITADRHGLVIEEHHLHGIRGREAGEDARYGSR